MDVSKNTSDEEIVAFARSENKSYYSYIIDRYESKLMAYVNRLTNHSPEAEDLVQQALVNAYINLHSFKIENKFSSWIYRIAHNLTINWLKKKKADISLDEDEILASKLAAEIDIIKEVGNNELSGVLIGAINGLPNKFKEPFILKYLEGKTYEEISDILRMPKNTVGTMISRAKNLLKIDLRKNV